MANSSNCKESAYCKYKDREEFWRFDHEFCYHAQERGPGGLVPRKTFTNAFPTTLENALFAGFLKCIQGCRKNPVCCGGIVRLNLPEFI